MPTSPPQVLLPTSLPRPNLRNIHGKRSPPEPAVSSMIMTFGPRIAALGVRSGSPCRVAQKLTSGRRQHVDVVVSNLATAVKPLVYDDRFLVGLREKIALEVLMPGLGCIGHVNVGHFSLGTFMDLAEVSFDPGTIAQAAFVAYGFNDQAARARCRQLSDRL